jgi:maleate isomerase
MTVESRGCARIGVLVPYTNCNLEGDLAQLRPPGVTFHVARLGGYDIDQVPDDKQMAGLGASDMNEPLRLIKGVRPHAILYGCTSATLTHGPKFDRELAAQIGAGTGKNVVSITAAGALVHALRTIGVTRVGFASPYVGAINDQAATFLASVGVETVARADIGRNLGNYGQGELTPDEVYALALRADADDVQALVLSCTDMRSVEVIERLEAATGKPVITSNQAMLFQTLQALELSPGWAPGRLFDHL